MILFSRVLYAVAASKDQVPTGRFKLPAAGLGQRLPWLIIRAMPSVKICPAGGWGFRLDKPAGVLETRVRLPETGWLKKNQSS
jgi:hypothetical protein